MFCLGTDSAISSSSAGHVLIAELATNGAVDV